MLQVGARHQLTSWEAESGTDRELALLHPQRGLTVRLTKLKSHGLSRSTGSFQCLYLILYLQFWILLLRRFSKLYKLKPHKTLIWSSSLSFPALWQPDHISFTDIISSLASWGTFPSTTVLSSSSAIPEMKIGANTWPCSQYTKPRWTYSSFSSLHENSQIPTSNTDLYYPYIGEELCLFEIICHDKTVTFL